MKNRHFLIIDLIEFLKPQFVDGKPSKSIFYSTKGVNLRIDQTKLAYLRSYIKSNPGCKIVVNPKNWSKLTILDFKTMAKVLNINHEAIDIVEMELFGNEEEMAQIFRAEEYIKYHTKRYDDISMVLIENDENLISKQNFIKKHLPDLMSRTKLLGDSEALPSTNRP